MYATPKLLYAITTEVVKHQQHSAIHSECTAMDGNIAQLSSLLELDTAKCYQICAIWIMNVKFR